MVPSAPPPVYHFRPTNTPQPWARPQQGLLGRAPYRSTTPAAYATVSPTVAPPFAEQPTHSATPPPWAWFGADQQPTALPQMFNSMSLQEPGEWVMDTGATDHVHASAGQSNL
ncbi:hypothetical protein L1887_38915 [Cichorium endivia]|nr:hypothetical protein L1887_38915 [Cichorium endivia]